MFYELSKEVNTKLAMIGHRHIMHKLHVKMRKTHERAILRSVYQASGDKTVNEILLENENILSKEITQEEIAQEALKY